MIDKDILLSNYVDEIVKLKEEMATLMKLCRQDTGLTAAQINAEVKAAEQAWREAE